MQGGVSAGQLSNEYSEGAKQCANLVVMHLISVCHNQVSPFISLPQVWQGFLVFVDGLAKEGYLISALLAFSWSDVLLSQIDPLQYGKTDLGYRAMQKSLLLVACVHEIFMVHVVVCQTSSANDHRDCRTTYVSPMPRPSLIHGHTSCICDRLNDPAAQRERRELRIQPRMIVCSRVVRKVRNVTTT